MRYPRSSWGISDKAIKAARAVLDADRKDLLNPWKGLWHLSDRPVPRGQIAPGYIAHGPPGAALNQAIETSGRAGTARIKFYPTLAGSVLLDPAFFNSGRIIRRCGCVLGPSWQSRCVVAFVAFPAPWPRGLLITFET